MITPVRFDPNGPDDFLDPARNVVLPSASLVEGTPNGADHVYFERESAGLKAGIWRSEPYVEWYESYPCDEFMYVLEGHVFVHNDEFSECYEKGSAFLLPRGFRGYWRQPVPMLKYYVIIE